MNEQNPATPANAAAPGNDSKVITPPSTTTTQAVPEGKVTIDLKEYRDLQRAKARTLSFDKRLDLARRNPSSQTIKPGDPTDPEGIKAISEAEARAEDAERRAMQMEVKGRVRDLLGKEEYKAIPQTTKDLILKNPAILSTAATLDEAMLDIEDYLNDTVGKIDLGMGGNAPKPKDGDPTPPGVTTPPSVPGAPAKVDPVSLEDTSNLTGSARSVATIRNSIKKANGVQ